MFTRFPSTSIYMLSLISLVSSITMEENSTSAVSVSEKYLFSYPECPEPLPEYPFYPVYLCSITLQNLLCVFLRVLGASVAEVFPLLQ
jgi:hypothetical protein